MTDKNTNLPFEYSLDPISIDPSEFTKKHMIRDASFARARWKKYEWIVDPIISTGSLCMFFGDPGTKKTLTMLSLAVCVALGKPWLGYETKMRKVLIVDEESGEKKLALRLGEAIRSELGDDMAIPIEFVSLAGFNLDDDKGEDELLSLIKTTDSGLVIIDSLAEIMVGDENTKKDTHPVFTALRRIAEETGAAIILIHRENKNDGYRGSSAIMGTLDLMVKVESKGDSNRIEFTTIKSRDSVAVNFAAEVTWNENQFHLRRTGVNEEDKPLSQSQSYVVQYLTKNGASTLPSIMRATDKYSDNAVKQAVYALRDMRRVYTPVMKGEEPGVEEIYDLTKEQIWP